MAKLQIAKNGSLRMEKTKGKNISEIAKIQRIEAQETKLEEFARL